MEGVYSGEGMAHAWWSVRGGSGAEERRAEERMGTINTGVCELSFLESRLQSCTLRACTCISSSSDCSRFFYVPNRFCNTLSEGTHTARSAAILLGFNLDCV